MQTAVIVDSLTWRAPLAGVEMRHECTIGPETARPPQLPCPGSPCICVLTLVAHWHRCSIVRKGPQWTRCAASTGSPSRNGEHESTPAVQAVLTELEASISRNAFTNWFMQTGLLVWRTISPSVTAPHAYAASTLQSRYANQVERSLSRILLVVNSRHLHRARGVRGSRCSSIPDKQSARRPARRPTPDHPAPTAFATANSSFHRRRRTVSIPPRL